MPTRVATWSDQPFSASAGRTPPPPPPTSGIAGSKPGVDGCGAPLTADGPGAAPSRPKPGVALGEGGASSASGTRYAPAVPAAPISRAAMMAGTSRRPVGRLAQACVVRPADRATLIGLAWRSTRVTRRPEDEVTV